MKVGDIVAREDGQNLRSGGNAYNDAVVIQAEPLVLVSRSTDMRWRNAVQDVAFKVTGTATDEQLKACMKRLTPSA